MIVGAGAATAIKGRAPGTGAALRGHATIVGAGTGAALTRARLIAERGRLS